MRILPALAGLFSAALAAQPLHQARAEEPERNILFFSKSSGYEHSAIHKNGDEPSAAERVLAEIGAKHNFHFTFTKDGSVFTPENIAKYDAFFFYTTGDLTTPGTDKNPPMSPEGKTAFLEAIHNGKGFIGTHSAADTFHSPKYLNHDNFGEDGDNADPYIKMLGAEFIIHGEQQKARMIPIDPNFPGIKAVGSKFAPTEEWYALKNFAPNLHVLLLEDTDGMHGMMYHRPPYPATWARSYGTGRVFYTNMGHREDVWANPVFQSVLTGGIEWAVGNVKADVEPNIEKVAPRAGETKLW